MPATALYTTFCQSFLCWPFAFITPTFFLAIATFAADNPALFANFNSLPPGDQEEKFVEKELPITRIIFFNTGIAQVIHSGTVSGNQRVKLSFDRRTVDDVLKSLVFEDSDGGHVQSVEYQPAPDQEDLAAQKHRQPLTVAQLFQRYRGEQISLELQDSAQSGAIFSVENRRSGTQLIESITLMNDDGLRTVAIEEIILFQFENRKIRQQFEQAMSGLVNSRESEKKSLDLVFTGKGKRNVRFAYVIDAPIWRMTYRLDSEDDQSTIQGWAHIDNVTKSDWRNVQIELRSGRARTFHVDLFNPLLGQRSSVGLTIFGVSPEMRVLSGGFKSAVSDSNSSATNRAAKGLGFGGGGFGGGGGGFGGGRGGGGLAAREDDPNLDIQSALQAVASVGRAERMVRFQIKEPVTLNAGKSAMIPVIIEKVPSSLLTVFDGFAKTSTPYLVAQIENKTVYAIVPGPVAIYKKGSFVGDAAMPRVEISDKTELNYGIDQPVSIDGEVVESVTKTENARFEKKMVQLKQHTTTIIEIKLTNRDSSIRKVLIKIAQQDGQYDPKPKTIRDDTLHYHYSVAPGSTVTKTITHVEKQPKLLRQSELPDRILEIWQKEQVEVDDELKQWIVDNRDIIARRKSATSKLAIFERHLTRAISEQNRMLKLVDVLTLQDEQRFRFVEKLVGLETEIEKFRPQVEASLQSVSTIRDEFNLHHQRFGSAK